MSRPRKPRFTQPGRIVYGGPPRDMTQVRDALLARSLARQARLRDEIEASKARS